MISSGIVFLVSLSTLMANLNYQKSYPLVFLGQISVFMAACFNQGEYSLSVELIMLNAIQFILCSFICYKIEKKLKIEFYESYHLKDANEGF